MKKQEAIDLGKAQGKQTFETLLNNGFIVITKETTLDRLMDIARGQVYGLAAIEKTHRPAYEDALLKAFVDAGMAVYWALPEVKEAQRMRAAMRWIDAKLKDRSSLRGLADALGDENQDPAYALSWAENAFRVAGKVSVAYKLRAILTEEEPKTKADGSTITPDDRLAYARETAMREAMREARYPSSSTSTTSNLIARYVAAAYAEFYDDTKYEW